jgi:hypothetical protein
MRLLRLAHDFVRRRLKDSGHGSHGPANFAAGTDEKRKDQLAGVQGSFPHQVSQRGRLPQTAGAARWELSKSGKTHAASIMKSAGGGNCGLLSFAARRRGLD